MGARGNLGYDAAERLMLGNLPEHNVGEDVAGTWRQPAYHRGRGFVAAGFKSENRELCGLRAHGSRSMLRGLACKRAVT